MGNPFRLAVFVGGDVVVVGVKGLEGSAVKAQLGVVLYLAVPQSHQEVGDIHGVPSGMHVVGICVDDVLFAGTWEDGFGCPLGITTGLTAELVGSVDVVSITFSPLDDVFSQVLGLSVAVFPMPQPEATPPAPMTGTQPTLSPVLGS